MHVLGPGTSRRKTSEKYLRFILKILNCGAGAVLFIQEHHRIKNYLL